MRQDKKRYAKNLRVKRELRDTVKEFVAKPTFDGMKNVQSKIDTAVKKNVLKKNTGARKMAQISQIAKDAGVQIPSKKATASKVTPKKAVTKKPAAKKTATKK